MAPKVRGLADDSHIGRPLWELLLHRLVVALALEDHLIFQCCGGQVCGLLLHLLLLLHLRLHLRLHGHLLMCRLLGEIGGSVGTLAHVPLWLLLLLGRIVGNIRAHRVRHPTQSRF